MEKINLADKFARFSEQWIPKIVAELDDYEVKLAKVEGEFVWHEHADADELFLVIEGELTIEMRDGAVTLGPGEMYVVPKGVEHRPRSEAECQILMVERKGTLNTGSTESDLTVAEPERI